MNSSSDERPTPLRTRASGAHPATRESKLRAEHDELAALTREVSAQVARGAGTELAAAIGVLQTRVLAHIACEEEDLFGRYAIYAPLDARQLLLEHAEIRRVLADLDVAVDLHVLRADAVDAFLKTLATHAAHENTGLYRWSTELAMPAK